MTAASQMHVINGAEATKLLPMPDLIESLRTAFVKGCEVPPRHHHTIQVPHGPDATLLLMPSWQTKREGPAYLGIKLVTVFPGNASRGAPGLTSSYLLFDSGTGSQLAMIDGNVITGRRTAAASALAAGYLSRPDAQKILVLGSGRVASLLPEAYRAVRDIRSVEVWDINPAGATRMVERLKAEGLDAKVSGDLEGSIKSADIVTSATLSTAPLIKGEWLRPGTHVDLIGAFTSTMRESDDEVVRRSSVFVDTLEALHEAGDLVQAAASGAFSDDALKATLEQLCRGERGGRAQDDEITVFKAVGTALEDLAAASMIYERFTNPSLPRG